MSIETVQAKTVALWYDKQAHDELSQVQVTVVTDDLKRLWSMYSGVLRILMKNKSVDVEGGLLKPIANQLAMFVVKGQFVCLTEDAPCCGIDGETYWHYKAVANILSHVMMWESFSYSGQKKAWVHIDNILHHTGSHLVTREFVRNDLFYKGAVNEYNSNLQAHVDVPSNKLVLNQFKTYAVS